jgi:hypothetical protein
MIIHGEEITKKNLESLHDNDAKNKETVDDI